MSAVLSAEHVDVRLARPMAEYVFQVAQQVLGREPRDLAQAIEALAESASAPTFQRIADAVNARQKALVILNTASVLKALTGQEVEILEAPGEEWWVRFAGSGRGVKVGRCDPRVLRAELAKAGREITAH